MHNKSYAAAAICLLALGIFTAARAQEAHSLLVFASSSDIASRRAFYRPRVPTAPPPRRASSSSIIITFLDSHTSNIDFSLGEFASQLDAIAALGYKFVSIDEVVSGKIEGKANVLVTIDDGNHSVYKAYMEVLKPRGIKPILFVYPAIILGHMRFALTAGQLVELAKDGCVIGAHGLPPTTPLSEKALAKNPKDFMIEVRMPGPAIERILGSTPLFFAYPFGVYSQEAEKDLKAAGYELAFAADDQNRPREFQRSRPRPHGHPQGHRLSLEQAHRDANSRAASKVEL